MSAPAVRTVVTEREANTNVMNASALVPGKSCVSVFVCVCFCVCRVPEPQDVCQADALTTFCHISSQEEAELVDVKTTGHCSRGIQIHDWL